MSDDITAKNGCPISLSSLKCKVIAASELPIENNRKMST
jgi:hypothetical protein